MFLSASRGNMGAQSPSPEFRSGVRRGMWPPRPCLRAGDGRAPWAVLVQRLAVTVLPVGPGWGLWLTGREGEAPARIRLPAPSSRWAWPCLSCPRHRGPGLEREQCLTQPWRQSC